MRSVKVGRQEGAFWNQHAIGGLEINLNISHCEIKEILCDTMEYYAAVRKNEIKLPIMTWYNACDI